VALKDLASDLSNFKYDQSSPDKVDNQINNGVDFFDDTKGGAVGFKPKTDLKSLYNKVQEGTVVAPNAGVRTNTKTRSAYGQMGEYSEEGNPGLSNPSHVLSNDNILGKRIQPQFTKDFMTTPIADYVSNYPAEASLTWGNTPTDKKEMKNFTVGRSNTRVKLINDKRRGVFDHSTPTSFEHQSFPVNQPNLMLNPTTIPDYNRYFSEMNGKSIHISPGEELKAGLRYNGLFGGSPNGIGITDVNSTIGGGVTPFASLIPIVNRTSQFSTPEQDGATNLYSTPLTVAQTTLNLPNFGGGVNPLDGTFSTQALTNVENLGIIDLYSKYENNDFTNVPSGQTIDNFFGTGNFKTVANKGPFAGNNTHPIYIRPMGSNWDDVLTETSGLGGTIGSILEGALDGFGILTRTSRDLADKVRIGAFLDSPAGKLFRNKQYALQALNPTIESKIYNPSSTLGIAGNNDFFTGNFLRGMLMKAGSYLLPTHVERHFGGLRYENVINLIPYDSDFEQSSRLAFQTKAFTSKVPIPPRPVRGGAVGLLDRAINFGISVVDQGLASVQIGFSNPNKYIPPVSSAPKSVHNGIVSFLGGPSLAVKDTVAALNKPGGTFNKNTAQSSDNVTAIKRHKTLAYSVLTINSGYEKQKSGKEIVEQIGSPGLNGVSINSAKIKGDLKTSNVDKVNALEYPLDYDGSPAGEVKDFIKFKFKDVVNNRFIIFRAILDGITDSIGAEYGEERYIGRPDKVYVYQGTNRDVSFNFSIYPKTKQEFPI